MDIQLWLICLLTFGIHLVGALGYAARIAGVRTGRIALSFALFNILVLFSRLSNGFLGPFLASRIEDALIAGDGSHLIGEFRYVLFAATLAAMVGALLIPSTQRWFSTAIGRFQHHRSVVRLAREAAQPGSVAYLRRTLAFPSRMYLRTLRHRTILPPRVIIWNILAQALLTVGVIASLYAGYLYPDYRVTASQLSAVVNGFATILLFIVIDPQLSVMTDDVVAGSVSEADFRRAIFWLSLSRIAGTVLAQALLLPAAIFVAFIAGLV